MALGLPGLQSQYDKVIVCADKTVTLMLHAPDGWHTMTARLCSAVSVVG